jgi:hypothetical protein
MKSPIKDFIKILDGACKEAIDWLTEQKDANMEEGFKVYLKDDKLPEGWAMYVLWRMSDKLDMDVLSKFADKIKDPMTSYLIAKKYKIIDIDDKDKQDKKDVMISSLTTKYISKLKNI